MNDSTGASNPRSSRLLVTLLVVPVALLIWAGCTSESNGDGPSASSSSSSGSSRSSSSSGSSGSSSGEDSPDAGEPEPTFEEDAGAPTPVGEQCLDNDDPGADEAAAMSLPEIDDCDKSGKGYGQNAPLKGVLEGASDVDVYKFHGKDANGCVVNPTVQSPTAGVETCLFVKCSTGTTNFKKCVSGTEKTSAGGNPGCCIAAPGIAQVDFSCGGLTQLDTSSDVFVQVKQTDDLCTPYQLAYHF